MSAILGYFRRASGIIAAQPGAITIGRQDDASKWQDQQCTLGCCHEIFTPQSTRETLPWWDSFSGMVITADVWLDNREELGRLFGVPSAQLPGVPDSSLILKAYQRWGADCPKYLLGDYAFAIWNPVDRTLFCARDHIGARPFYYSLNAEQFVFASDINVVLATPGVSQQWDEPYLAAVLTDKRFQHPERTFYQAVLKLPPGHTLTVQPGRVHLARYWFPQNAPDVRYRTDAEYAEALRELLTQSVGNALNTVHPVAAHLSGGLDSSSITVLAARQLRRQGKAPPEVFCWQPSPEANIHPTDDLDLIQTVCAQEGLMPRYFDLKPDDYLRFLRRDSTRQPTETTLFSEDLVQQAAAEKGVRVLLSGWGGDEAATFDGRGYYAELLRQGKLGRVWRESAGNPLMFILRHTWHMLLPFETRKRLADMLKGQLLPHRPYIHPEFARRVKPLPGSNAPIRETGVRQVQLKLLTHGHLVERIEAWYANAARYKIVYRYPFLDRRVLEFALGLPPEQFIRGKWKRWLIRNAMNGILPDEVCWNKRKFDPARFYSAKNILPKALAQAGQTLAALPQPPSRADYVDLPRLVRDLTTDFDPENTKKGINRAALQFLDW